MIGWFPKWQNNPQVKWKSEKELFNLFKQFYSDATFQQRFSWLGRKSLDVFLPSKNVAIEYQGLQHFRAVDYFGGKTSFKEQQKNDREKIKLCKKHNIKLYYFSNDKNSPNNFNGLKIYKDENELLNQIRFGWFYDLIFKIKVFCVISIILLIICLIYHSDCQYIFI